MVVKKFSVNLANIVLRLHKYSFHAGALRFEFRCYYFPEKRKFSGILCFRQQRSRRGVTISILITFEGFKLHSSNLTHALLIQIYRTSSIIYIVVPSKMAAGGHFV